MYLYLYIKELILFKSGQKMKENQAKYKQKQDLLSNLIVQ